MNGGIMWSSTGDSRADNMSRVHINKPHMLTETTVAMQYIRDCLDQLPVETHLDIKVNAHPNVVFTFKIGETTRMCQLDPYVKLDAIKQMLLATAEEECMRIQNGND